VSEKVVLHLRGGVGRQISTPTYSWDQKNANKIENIIPNQNRRGHDDTRKSHEQRLHCPVIADNDYDNIKLYKKHNHH
jgi:hypothetical protein